MKHLILLSMSIISLLFGCGGRSNKPTQDLPWFPNTDNAAVKVEEMPLDSDYVVRNFIVLSERKEVVVLTQKQVSADSPAAARQRTDYQILCFSADGKLLRRKDLPNFKKDEPALLWMEHNNLVFYLHDNMRLYDIETLDLVEEVPYYTDLDFPSKGSLKNLDPEAQLKLYLSARASLLKNSSSTRVLYLPRIDSRLLLVKNNQQKRSLWYLVDSLEIDAFTRQYGQIEPPGNPGYQYNPETGMFQLSDGTISFKTTAEVPTGAYFPNYKLRYAIQYVLRINGQTAHFATTNRSQKPLYVKIAQNGYLSAADKEAWIAYRGILYRLE